MWKLWTNFILFPGDDPSDDAMSGVDPSCSSDDDDSATASFSSNENAYASAGSPDSGGEISGLDDDFIDPEQAAVSEIIIKHLRIGENLFTFSDFQY